MRRKTKASAGRKTSNWLGLVSMANSKEMEKEADAKFYIREKIGDRIKKQGIKVGAKFTGHIGNDKRKLVDDYVVTRVDTTKEVVILKGKKDEKTRRVSVLNKIFG